MGGKGYIQTGGFLAGVMVFFSQVCSSGRVGQSGMAKPKKWASSKNGQLMPCDIWSGQWGSSVGLVWVSRKEYGFGLLFRVILFWVVYRWSFAFLIWA